jgi:hypothetical protein
MTQNQQSMQKALSSFFSSCERNVTTVFYDIGTAASHYAKRWQ